MKQCQPDSAKMRNVTPSGFYGVEKFREEASHRFRAAFAASKGARQTATCSSSRIS